MSYRKITQTEARQFRKERDEAQGKLRNFLRRGATEYGGDWVAGLEGVNDVTKARIETARRLGYAVFADMRDDGKLSFRAVK